jgi:hypothetical protein
MRTEREGRVRARGLSPPCAIGSGRPPAASPRDCAGAIGALTAMGQEWPEYGGSLAGSGTRPRNRLQLAYDNLWDYDTASQPPLFVWCGNLPAVAMMNKTGMVYMFNRLQHGETLVALRWGSEL